MPATDTARAAALITHALRCDRSRHAGDAVTADWLRLTPDGEAHLLRRLGARERWFLPLARTMPRALLWLVDRRVPRTSAHILWRKLWFFAQARAFLATGRQVLCLGAGLDALGTRLATGWPEARICELDRPDLMRWKAAAAPTVECIPSDLRVGLPHTGLDPTAPTLVLAEGLLMYLDGAAIEHLLASLRATLTGPITMAFSCVDRRALAVRERPIARLQAALRKRGRETLRWATEPETVRVRLEAAGFAVETTQSPGEYGEFVVRATQKPTV